MTKIIVSKELKQLAKRQGNFILNSRGLTIEDKRSNIETIYKTYDNEIYYNDYKNHLKGLILMLKNDDVINIYCKANNNTLIENAGLVKYELVYYVERKAKRVLHGMLDCNVGTSSVNPFIIN